MTSIVAMTPMEFFRMHFVEALRRERVSITPLSEYYVVGLLAGDKARECFPADALHDRFANATHESPATRDVLFRDIGDRALLSGGLWWTFDARHRGVSWTSALIDLGRSAYWTIGEPPFEELAEKFEGVTYALVRLGADAQISTLADVLRLYSLWQETRSGHAYRALISRGILPTPVASAPS